MINFQHIYLSGKINHETDPLVRYLPAFPQGAPTAWLEKELVLAKKSWIIDPFGTTPFLALECARQGYSVLMVSNNPVINFMVQIFASAPSESDFKAALSEISKIRRGDEWLDHHLANLYATQCPNCAATATATSYIWKKGDPFPFSCSFSCKACHAVGEKDFDQKDIENYSLLANDKLPRVRAMQRVTDLDSDLQQEVSQVLDHYLPRPLYFITTLINKIDGSNITPDRKKLLLSLILTVCDQGNTLWGTSSVHSHPKQLQTPPTFKEYNLWLALEKAAAFWSGQSQAVELTVFPTLPRGNGAICLFPNRLRSIDKLPPALAPKAIINIYPRPNQAFWTLSAMWSGWLWGKEAVLPMKGVLERKRYDWNWLNNALCSSLSHLVRMLPSGVPFFSLIPELESGYISACLHATTTSGFSFSAAAMQEEDEIVQTWWTTGQNTKPPVLFKPDNAMGDAIEQTLIQVSEPLSYLKLYINALIAACQTGLFLDFPVPPNTTAIKQFQTIFDKALSTGPKLVRFNHESTAHEKSLWGLVKYPELMSLTDRVEMEIVNFLHKNSSKSLPEIENHLFQTFPGFSTPSSALIKICLSSYGEEILTSPVSPGKWQLHSRENPINRKIDIHTMMDILNLIGSRLGFNVVYNNPLLWMDAGGEVDSIYYIMGSSIISRVIMDADQPARQKVIVLPGSRSELLFYKLEQNPQLFERVENKHWKFLKFRHLRSLSQKEIHSPALWSELITLDPPIWQDAVQMNIFNA